MGPFRTLVLPSLDSSLFRGHARSEARDMERFTNMLLREDGATAVEYAVMLALIIGTLFGAITVFGSQAGGLWSGINGNLSKSGVK